MSNKRLTRKRLFNVEKEGIHVDVGTGEGLKNSIISTTQHREGSKVETDILIDLGTSKGTILTGGFDTSKICGEAGLASKLCTLDHSVFGIVTEIRVICLEQITTNGEAYSEGFDILIGTDGDGVTGGEDTTGHAIATGLERIAENLGADQSKTFDLNTNTSGKSLYIGSADTIGSAVKAAAVLSGLDGYANIATGTKLELYKADGTKVELLFDTALAHGTGQALKIGLNGAGGVGDVEASVKVAVDAVGFTATVGAADGSVSIAQTAAGPAGNSDTLGADKQNSVTKASGDTSSLAIAQFTGGTAPGVTSANVSATITGGKFLIRVYGFLAPADL